VHNILKLEVNSPAVEALSCADKKLGSLISEIGDFQVTLRTDYVASVIRAIVGQQLSVKAAKTIWNRTEQLCGEISPGAILALNDEQLRAAGLSRGKISYVRDFCEKVLSGEINFDTLCSQDDDYIINTLITVKGIGQWTAEMFLIFSLGRQDILSLKDAGLQRAIKWLYHLDSVPSAEQMLQLGTHWQPYRTVASLYLWEALNRGLEKAAPGK
jgi:DNA-3-methyladenine glycosylase II